MHADETQCLKIWRFMLEMGQLSPDCIRNYYISNLTWNNQILHEHHMNHVFIKVDFSVADLSHPLKLMVAEESFMRKRKNGPYQTSHSSISPKVKRRRHRVPLRTLQSRYRAKREAKQLKLQLLGYPIHSGDESDAQRQHQQLQQRKRQKQNSSAKKEDEQASVVNVIVEEDNHLPGPSGLCRQRIHSDHESSQEIPVTGHVGLAPPPAKWVNAKSNSKSGSSKTVKQRVTEWVNNTDAAPQDILYHSFEGDTLYICPTRAACKMDQADDDETRVKVDAGEINNEQPDNEPAEKTLVDQSTSPQQTQQQTSPLSPSPTISPANPERAAASSTTDSSPIDDSNVTVRPSKQSITPSDNPTTSDLTNLTSITGCSHLTGEECLMSTQSLLDYTPSPFSEAHDDDDNAQDGKLVLMHTNCTLYSYFILMYLFIGHPLERPSSTEEMDTDEVSSTISSISSLSPSDFIPVSHHINFINVYINITNFQ